MQEAICSEDFVEFRQWSPGGRSDRRGGPPAESTLLSTVSRLRTVPVTLGAARFCSASGREQRRGDRLGRVQVIRGRGGSLRV